MADHERDISRLAMTALTRTTPARRTRTSRTPWLCSRAHASLRGEVEPSLIRGYDLAALGEADEAFAVSPSFICIALDALRFGQMLLRKTS